MAGESKTTLDSVAGDGRREHPRRSKGTHERCRIKEQCVFFFPRFLRYHSTHETARSTWERRSIIVSSCASFLGYDRGNIVVMDGTSALPRCQS